MEQSQAAKLIEENLKNIFAYCLSRLCDKEEAEDLTGDIVCEVLSSAHRLKNDSAFHAFMWRIADNTFKNHIRKKQSTMVFDEGYMGVYWDSDDNADIKEENISLLRRELSLLSKQYREVTVRYYIYGKKCSEISQELNISPEMVKYYLFKTRKILKEGFGMTRQLGEKSYNPGMFQMDYWGGGDNSCFWKLFERKLPGNILLSCYFAPVTIQELSVELGVAVPYLEEEIEILIKHEMLTKTGNKYQTQIIIFKEEWDKEILSKIRPIYEKVAADIISSLELALPKLKTIDFKGNDYNNNRLRWTFINIAMVYALSMTDKKQKERFGSYPPLVNGSHGFVFGYDNDFKDHHFHGIYGHCENKEKTAYFSVENYRIIESYQDWRPICWDKSVAAMTDAILNRRADEENDMLTRLIAEEFIASNNGKLSAMFPVFGIDIINGIVYDELKAIINRASNCMIEICDTAAKIVKRYAPKSLSEKSEQLTTIRYQMDTMAFIVETRVEKEYLKMPTTNEKPCVFGVIR